MLGTEWLEVNENEEEYVRAHPSKWVIFKQLVASSAMLILIIAIALHPIGTSVEIGDLQLRTAVIALIPIVLLLPVSAQVQRLATYYIITDTNVWVKKKLFARDVDPIVLSRVQGVNYSQSFLDRQLNKGTVRISTAGTGDVEAVLREVPNPQRATRLIRDGIEDATQEQDSTSLS